MKKQLAELVQELAEHGYRVKPIQSNTPSRAAKLIQLVSGEKRQEHFVVVTLNTQFEPINTHVISIGTLGATHAHVRDVFFAAITDNSHSIILGHNHPSGDVSPSDADIDVTERLIEVGKIMDIAVSDHIIVAKDDFCSIREVRGQLWA